MASVIRVTYPGKNYLIEPEISLKIAIRILGDLLSRGRS